MYMESCIKITSTFLLSLILIVASVDGRKDPGEYWRVVMKGQAMPEAISAFMHEPYKNNFGSKSNFKNSKQQKDDDSFIRDFDPVPNISVYHDNAKLEETSRKTFATDFDPIPNISVYHDDANLKKSSVRAFATDFDPIPNLSVYHNDAKLEIAASVRTFATDFNPVPNISVYHDDVNLNEATVKNFTTDFDPIPNLSVYHDE